MHRSMAGLNVNFYFSFSNYPIPRGASSGKLFGIVGQRCASKTATAQTRSDNQDNEIKLK